MAVEDGNRGGFHRNLSKLLVRTGVQVAQWASEFLRNNLVRRYETVGQGGFSVVNMC